ncbi:unnamed protein product [Leuciscus chuanchicus]
MSEGVAGLENVRRRPPYPHRSDGDSDRIKRVQQRPVTLPQSVSTPSLSVLEAIISLEQDTISTHPLPDPRRQYSQGPEETNNDDWCDRASSSPVVYRLASPSFRYIPSLFSRLSMQSFVGHVITRRNKSSEAGSLRREGAGITATVVRGADRAQGNSGESLHGPVWGTAFHYSIEAQTWGNCVRATLSSSLQAAHPSTGLLGKSSQSILGLGLPRFYEGTVPLCALEVLTPSLCPASCAKPWHLQFFGIEQTPYGWIDPGVRSQLVVTQVLFPLPLSFSLSLCRRVTVASLQDASSWVSLGSRSFGQTFNCHAKLNASLLLQSFM